MLSTLTFLQLILKPQLSSCLNFIIYFEQSLQSALLTARGCTVSSRTRLNATCSGTAGTARRPATSAAPDLPTTGKRACACGPTRSPSAETRVRTGFHFIII